MRVCEYCGRENDDNSNFCASCGKTFTQNNNAQGFYTQYDQNQMSNNQMPNNQGYYNQGYGQQQPYNPNGKDVVLWVVLSIITCGICGIIWMVSINDEMNRRTNDMQAPTGVMVFVLTLVTCGIYGYIWAYKMGEKMDYLKRVQGGNSPILFLILQIFGLGIVNYAVMQDYLNKN